MGYMSVIEQSIEHREKREFVFVDNKVAICVLSVTRAPLHVKRMHIEVVSCVVRQLKSCLFHIEHLKCKFRSLRRKLYKTMCGRFQIDVRVNDVLYEMFKLRKHGITGNQVFCGWDVRVPRGFRIKAHVEKFQTHSFMMKCHYGLFTMIFPRHWRKYIKLCGYKPSMKLISPEHDITLSLERVINNFFQSTEETITVSFQGIYLDKEVKSASKVQLPIIDFTQVFSLSTANENSKLFEHCSAADTRL